MNSSKIMRLSTKSRTYRYLSQLLCVCVFFFFFFCYCAVVFNVSIFLFYFLNNTIELSRSLSRGISIECKQKGYIFNSAFRCIILSTILQFSALYSCFRIQENVSFVIFYRSLCWKNSCNGFSFVEDLYFLPFFVLCYFTIICMLRRSGK